MIGHECLGRVAEVGKNVTELAPGDYAVPTVRRPGNSLLAEIGARYISTAEMSLKDAAATYGPFDLMFEATGFAPIVFEAMERLGKNGVLVLSSVTGGGRDIQVPADMINLGFVLGNKVMVGTVNANRDYFEAGAYDLSRAELEFPGWLSKLLTHPVDGLDRYQEMMRLLTQEKGAIKVFVNVAAEA